MNLKKKKNIKSEITIKINQALRVDLKPPYHEGKWVAPREIVEASSPHIREILHLQTGGKPIPNELYQYLHSIELLTIAHNTIYKNKGSATEGTTEETIEGFPDKKIELISESIKNKTFEWTPIRLVEIPRPGKKSRPLGISTYGDKLVQFVCTLILNAIYDPIFQKDQYNHGFRPHHSCQDNIIDLTHYKNQGLNMAIEGDISGAFNNVNHKKLIGILKKKIKDIDFLKIIKKACKNQVAKFNKLKEIKEEITPELGTPQGCIMSPILFNIYMFDFDEYIVNKLKKMFDEINETNKQNKTIKPDKTYYKYELHIIRRKRRLNKLTLKNLIEKLTVEEKEEIKSLKKEIEEVKGIRSKLNSLSIIDKKLRFKYTRYADDFIILTNAPMEICLEIRRITKEYLKDRLDLELNDTKTKITNLKEKPAFFLGYAIYMSNPTPKFTETGKFQGRIKRRGGSMVIKIGIDYERRNNQLIAKNYARLRENKLFPSRAPYLTPFPIQEIIAQYNQIMDGICNYYFRVITNKSQLNSLLYYLYYSCIFTIASKLKTSTAKIFQQYGWQEYDVKNKPTGKKQLVFSYHITDKKGINTTKHIMLQDYKHCMIKALRVAYNVDFKTKDPGLLTDERYWRLTKAHWRTSTTLPRLCYVCGSIEDVEIHHTNALRKRNPKKTKEKEPLHKFMSSIIRKKIPLCREHHRQVHSGKYSDMSLKNIYDERLPYISTILQTDTSPRHKIDKYTETMGNTIEHRTISYFPEQKVVRNPYKNTDYKYIPKYTPNKEIKLGEPTTMQRFIRKYFDISEETKPTYKSLKKKRINKKL